jgi:hypothetical protein
MDHLLAGVDELTDSGPRSTRASGAGRSGRAATSFVGTGSPIVDVGSRIVVTDGESGWFSAGPKTTDHDGAPTWRSP